MKRLLLILAFIPFLISATNYYVSTSGNDAANGLSPATAWQTISKINSTNFAAGDSVLLKRGDTFTGTISKISKSGVSGNPIVFGAYGSGNNPVISGFTTITGWTNEGGGIYSKAITAPAALNTVMLNNKLVDMGRTPNTGYLTFTSQTNTSLTSASLSGQNYTGYTAVVKNLMYEVNRRVITSHSGSTINWTDAIGTWSYGNGFFLQNNIATLDQFGEWFWNGTTLYMYFGAETTTSHTVKVGAATDGMLLRYSNYNHVVNIDFEGFNENGITVQSSQGVNIKGCNINFIGLRAINGATNYGATSQNLLVENCSITWVGNTGIDLLNEFTAPVIRNNYISDIALNLGLLPNTNQSKSAIRTYRTENFIIKENVMRRLGYAGTSTIGDNSIIRKNVVDSFCVRLDDGAAIYTYTGATLDTRYNHFIDSNLVLNGVGTYEGKTLNELTVYGIYLDNSTDSTTITDNLVLNVARTALAFNSAPGNTVDRNIWWGFGQSGWQIGDFNSTPAIVSTLVSGKHNIFYTTASGATVRNIVFKRSAVNLRDMGDVDENIYIGERIFSTATSSWVYSDYDFAGWQALGFEDANSEEIDVTPELHYTDFDSKTVTFTGYRKTDVYGNTYDNSITLEPFESVVFVSSQVIAPYRPRVASGDGKVFTDKGKTIVF